MFRQVLQIFSLFADELFTAEVKSVIQFRKLQRLKKVDFIYFDLTHKNMFKMILKITINHPKVLWKTTVQKIFSRSANLQEKHYSTGVFLAIQGNSSESSHAALRKK